MLDDPAGQASELGYLVVQGDAGVDDSYFEVLQAEEQIYILQQALVQTQVDQLNTIVQFYRALGGLATARNHRHSGP